MSSYPSQDPNNQSGYGDYVPESTMTQEELEEAKQSYQAGLQQRIGQLERELSDRKPGKKGSKGHSGSSSKSSKKSSRHKYASSSSTSGSAMPTYPVSYSQSGYAAGYDDATGGGGQSSSSQAATGAYTDGSGQQWVWSSSQGWVPAQENGANSGK